MTNHWGLTILNLADQREKLTVAVYIVNQGQRRAGVAIVNTKWNRFWVCNVLLPFLTHLPSNYSHPLAYMGDWFQDPPLWILKPKDAQVHSIKCRIICINLYLCVGYQRVGLYFTSFIWTQCRAWCYGKFKFCFLKLSGILFSSNILDQQSVDSRGLTVYLFQLALDTLLSFCSIPASTEASGIGIGCW